MIEPQNFTLEDDDGKRPLFHKRMGGFDLQRLFEQLLPNILIGAIVVFANLKVIEYQVSEMRREIDTTTKTTANQQMQLAAVSEKLATVAAQMTAFLGQQVLANATTDARMTFMEHNYMNGAAGAKK